MNSRRRVAFLLCWALFHQSAALYAAEGDSVISRRSKIKILPVPTFGYAPETGTYAGAVGLFALDFYQDSLTRTSNAKVEFTYTWRKQIIAEAGWNYFFRHENWYTQGLLHYSRYPDLYYGIGEKTSETSEVPYQTNRIILDGNLLKKIGNRIFLGPKVVYKQYAKLDYNAPVSYPELRNERSLGAGFTLLKDTRNNLLNASKGVYFELSNTFHSAASNYAKIFLDARGYRAITKKAVGALRFYSEHTAGPPPFYDYALLGGDKLARGYYYGRFRDKNLSTLQLEVRHKIIGRLGVAAFGGLTKLYPDFRNLSFENTKPNYGGGLRFLIDRKSNINLRMDYAVGQTGSGFYIAFGESF